MVDLELRDSRSNHCNVVDRAVQHRGDTLQPVFRMSGYNIVRKHEVLETSLKYEEITNFYLIFLYFQHFYTDFFQNCNVFFL